MQPYPNNPEDPKDWERHLDRPWRVPAREVAVAGPLLARLNDGQPIQPTTLHRLRGGKHYARPALGDPTIPEPTDPLAILVGQEDATERAEMCERVKELLSCLSSREIAVVRLRFGLDGDEPLGPGAIAKRLGISRKTAYNVELRALDKLRGDEQAAHLLEVCDDLAV
jgi:DNA-binding CsgD family transcriptional regulator